MIPAIIAASLDWTAFLFQSLALFGPAYYLSGLTRAKSDREQRSGRRVITTTLWAAGLIHAHYLQSLAIGVYNWPVALALHTLTVAFCIVVIKLFRAGSEPNHSFAQTSVSAPSLQAALESPLVRFAWLAVVATTIAGLILNLRTPPGGWDALTYHLDFPAQWVLAGQIFPALTGYGDYSPTYYPTLVEAFAGWYLLPGRGTGFVDLIQIIFAPMMYCALRDIAYFYATTNRISSTTIDRTTPRNETNNGPIVSIAAEFAPLCIISLPYLQSSLLVADNDFVLCALLVAVWHATLFSGVRSLATTAAAALVLTVKYTGLVYLAALALVIVPLLAVTRRSDQTPEDTGESRAGKSRRPSWRRMAVLAGMISLGGSPYFLNWFSTGNPLYPATVEFSGLQIFDGYYPRAFFEQHPFHRFNWRAFFTDPGLSLPVWFAAGGMLLSSTLWLRGKTLATSTGNARRTTVAGVVLIPLVLFLAFYFFVPLRQARLALPALACCGPALVLFEIALIKIADQAWRMRATQLLGFLLSGGVLLQCLVTTLRFAEAYGDPRPFAIQIALNEISRSTARILADASMSAGLFLIFVLAIAGLLALSYFISRKSTGRFAVAICVAILPALLIFEQQYTTYRGEGLAQTYRIVERLQSATTDFAGNIGVVGTNALLPLRGRRPRAPNSDTTGHVYLMLNRPNGNLPLHLREESLRYDTESKGWLAIGTLAFEEIFAANLKRYDIQTLIVATTIGTNGRWPAEYEWMQAEAALWKCETEISNAISGDPGARLAICVRR